MVLNYAKPHAHLSWAPIYSYQTQSFGHWVDVEQKWWLLSLFALHGWSYKKDWWLHNLNKNIQVGVTLEMVSLCRWTTFQITLISFLFPRNYCFVFFMRLCDLNRNWNPFAQVFNGLRYFKFLVLIHFMQFKLLISMAPINYARLLTKLKVDLPESEPEPKKKGRFSTTSFYPQWHRITCWMFAVIKILRIR